MEKKVTKKYLKSQRKIVAFYSQTTKIFLSLLQECNVINVSLHQFSFGRNKGVLPVPSLEKFSAVPFLKIMKKRKGSCILYDFRNTRGDTC